MSLVAPRPVDAPAAHRRDGEGRRAPTSLWSLAVATLVLVAALSGVGGTYAMWSDQQTMDAGTLSAGTAELTADWVGGAPASDNLLPGDSVTRTAQLHNSGDVPLALSVSAPTVAPGFTVRAAVTCEALLHAPVLGASAVPMGPAATGESAVVIQPGDDLEACVAVTATSELVPSSQLTYTLEIEGTQVR